MPTQNELNKLLLINTIDQYIDGYIFYQLLLENDGKVKFIYISDQIKNYNSHSLEEIKNNPKLLYDNIHPDYTDYIINTQNESYRNLNNFQAEFPLLVNNEYKWLSVTSVPIKKDNGDVVWNGIQIDITEKKRQELKIKKQNRILLLLNTINDKINEFNNTDVLLENVIKSIVEIGSYKLVWISIKPEDDDKNQIVKVYKSYGVTEYLNHIYIDLSDPAMSQGPTANTLKYNVISVTNNITTATNYQPWLDKANKFGLRSSAVFPFNIKGKIASINIYSEELDSFNKEEIELLERIIKNLNNAIHSIDVENDKKIADKLLIEKINELKKSEANLRTIFNHTKIRYALLDKDFNILMLNSSFKNDFEFLNNSKIDIGYNLLENVIADRRKTLLTMIDNLQNKIIDHSEFELKYKKDNEECFLNVTYFPVYLNDGINSYLIISEDITERKKHEIERQLMIDNLLLRNEKLEKFAFIVSHVLRAPVANILGLNSLINEDKENLDKYLKLLDDSTLKLDKVIRELNETLQQTKSEK